MNNNTFLAGMAMLQKLFGVAIDNEITTAYWNILKKISDDDFIRVQGSLIESFVPTSQVPFPLPAHFLKALGMDIETKTKLAIMAIKDSGCNPYATVSFGDRALHKAIEIFGGWPIVACWDLEKWQYNEKQFAMTYQAALKDNDGPAKLLGIYEFENKGKCFPENQMKYVKAGAEIQFITWKGFDKNIMQIESENNEQQKLLDNLTGNLIKSMDEKAVQ